MTSARPALTILTAIGAVMALNSLLFGTQLIFDPSPFSEVARTGTHLAYQVTLLAGLVALAQTLPRLTRVVGRHGSGFPAAVLLFAGVGVTLDACTRFAEAFMVPFIGRNAPELLDQSPGGALMTVMVSAWMASMLGLVAVALVAYRRRIFPRPAAVVLAVGALVVPVVGPLSGILVGTGLAWGGYAARRRLELPPAPADAVPAVA
jgi:hypothetical protein